MADKKLLPILPRMEPPAPLPPPRPMTATSAWAVYAWPTILWQAPCTQECHFKHLGTQVTTYSTSETPCRGQTVWGDEQDKGSVAGLAWDWIELGAGVVAMADPLAVLTNLRLVGPGGGVLTPLEAALHLNELVHALPWQQEVQLALARIGH